MAFSKRSPVFQELMAGPVPTDVAELLFVHDVLRLVKEDLPAERIYGLAEYRVLQAMQGVSPEPVAGPLYAAAALDPPADMEKLRREARARSIAVIHDAATPSSQHRVLRNQSALTVTAFEVLVAAPSGKGLLCKYEGSLAPRTSATVACEETPMPAPNGTGEVIAVGVEPGSYLNKEGGGVFASSTAATRTRLAALSGQAQERSRENTVMAAQLAGVGAQLVSGITLLLIGTGVALGRLVGARRSPAWWPIGGIAVATAAVAALAGATATAEVSRAGGLGGADTMSMLLVSAIGFGAAVVMAAAWLAFNAGVWLGAFWGYMRRRGGAAPA